ncbi:MAG: DUF4976 domain-containing protein, partial [Verrucomicrobia bacterium]|nr:DUF4976 domain-containing protein [Verrucomicrobiota bacterium]
FERTVFVMGADNGLSLGEHGLLGKQNLYEHGGMHVPMIFVGPGIPKDETKSFAYLYDIYPTMCELAGIPIPGGLDAKSLVPVITGKQPKVRDYMFNAYQASQRSIRDERWKLIRYPLVNKTQLFDLQADPHEMTDLADKPESAPKIAELTAQLETARQEFGDTDPLIVPNPKSPDWSPPAPVKDAAKPKPATATTQPGGRIRADSKLHFERWDTNKDDSLTLEEYQSGQKNRKGLEAGFKTYDKNADGKLSREEYVDPRSK